MPASCKGGRSFSLSLSLSLSLSVCVCVVVVVVDLATSVCIPQAHRQRELALEGRVRETESHLEQKRAELRQLEWGHADTLQEKSVVTEK